MPTGSSLADKAIGIIRLFKNTKGEFAGKPFNLQPWQEDILRLLFRTDESGRRIVREAFIFLPRKNGKALAVDTPILTERGWSTMAALNVGDRVIGSDGRATAIVMASETFTGHRCYRVELSDGRSIVADAGHLWTVRDRYLERDITLSTEEMLPRVLVGSRPTHRERRYSLPAPVVVDLPWRDLPLDPYLLGVWLGDGTTKRGEITTADDEIEEAFASGGFPASYRYQRCAAATLGLPGLMAQLRDLGVLGNKHIPADYLTASEYQRRALLAGLMDTDGCAIGSGRQTACEFTSTNAALADGVLFLARSLGWKPALNEGRATLYGKDCGPKYRVQWVAWRDDSPFRLLRKTARLLQRPTDGRNSRSRSVQVTAIVPVESVPTRCIQVAASDGIYLAGPGLIPTHNSELIAAIALFHLLFEGEPGAEVILGASDKDQASIVFRACEEMARQDANLLRRCKPLPATKTIAVKGSNQFLRAIPADEGGAHGLNPSLVVADELHAWKGRGLYDALRTGQGARRAPMFIVITTAGFDKNSICFERYDYAKKVRDGIINDESFLPIIYEAEDEDDWTSEAVWRKANPALRGETPFRSIDEMRRMCKEAQQIPAMQNAFRRLYLNQWTEQDTRWLDQKAWKACARDAPSFSERNCFAGLDLASTTDIAAFVMAFPDEAGGYDVLARFWVPREGIERRAKKDRAPYQQWVEQGFIKATDGNVIDYDVIREDIKAMRDDFDIREIAADRWNATQIITQLTGDGFTVVPFGQGFASMTAPTKELEKLVISQKLNHGGNPVLNWMAANVAVEQDAAGNMKPSKAKSTQRIDGIVALVMAIGRAIATKAESGSVYEERGMVVL